VLNSFLELGDKKKITNIFSFGFNHLLPITPIHLA